MSKYPYKKHVKTYKNPIYLKTMVAIVTMISMVTEIANSILLQQNLQKIECTIQKPTFLLSV